MRTSIKLIVAALAVFLLSMAIYDKQLHSELEKGAFKEPFGDYVASHYTGFRNIHLKSASTVNIKIQKGPYRVLIEPSANQYVHLEMNRDTLEIETVFPNEYHSYRANFGMYISCPEISSIRSDAYYHIRSREYLDKDAQDYFKFRRTTIDGFTQDSLHVTATHASNIWLLNDTIKNLDATIGVDSASAS